MKPVRILFLCASIAAAAPAFAGEDEAFGHALTLVQTFIRAAAHADDPAAGARALDDVLSGRDSEASRAFAGLFQEMTAGLPAAQRDQVASIGMDLAAIARREAARAPFSPISASGVNPELQARKDLTAMGLRYYDEQQFLDAVKRRDKLAVDLFVAGKGIDPAVVSRSLPEAR